jgi:tetratricopeptide (TPR) repeat protein
MRKDIYSIFIATLLLFTVLSCSLDRDPLDRMSESQLWTSEENALLGLTGIYRNSITYNGPEYTPSDWWSYGGLIFLEFATDNGYDRRGIASGFHKMTSGELLANNNFINNYWINSYSKIAKANRFLEGVELLNASENVVRRFKAEARFLRATQYQYLYQFFGSVPLIEKVLTMEQANNVKKESKESLKKFIENELRESADDLPTFSSLKESERGRASKQAALAFLGRLYLTTKEFDKASSVYEEIINLGENSISSNYVSLFTPSGENSNENIFSIQYMEDLAGNAMPQHAFPVKDGGWCLINVSGSLFEAYEFIDGTPFDFENPLYNPNNLGENRDPRLNYTIYYNGATFRGATYNCHPDGNSSDRIASGQTTQTGFMMRKYFDESFSGDLNSYGGNIPIIRYAEVLLSYLEAKLESGATIDQELLDNTINKVRGRASVNMPKITTTSADELRTILRNERRVELAMEGIRYWDLLRWETAHIELTKYILGAPFPGSVRTSKYPDGTVDSYGRWYVGKRNFRKDSDYQWPIPQREQEINPNLRD